MKAGVLARWEGPYLLELRLCPRGIPLDCEPFVPMPAEDLVRLARFDLRAYQGRPVRTMIVDGGITTELDQAIWLGRAFDLLGISRR